MIRRPSSSAGCPDERVQLHPAQGGRGDLDGGERAAADRACARPRGRVHIEDPCEAYSFVQAYTATANTGYQGRNGAARLGALRAACLQRPTPATVIDQPDGASPPPDTPPAATPGDEAPGEPPTVNPPQDAATPDAVGADAPPAVEASADAPAPGVPDGRPVEARAHDPQAPLPDAAVGEELAAAGQPGDDTSRVWRNEPTPGLPHYEFGRNDASRPELLADPIDVFAGALIIEQADATIPGARRPLQLIRRYRSGVPWFGPWGSTGITTSMRMCARSMTAGWASGPDS